PASSGFSMPTSKSGCVMTGSEQIALSRTSGPSLHAQPAPRTMEVSFTFPFRVLLSISFAPALVSRMSIVFIHNPTYIQAVRRLGFDCSSLYFENVFHSIYLYSILILTGCLSYRISMIADQFKSITIQQLEALVFLVEERSFSEAAKKMLLSQPSI